MLKLIGFSLIIFLVLSNSYAEEHTKGTFTGKVFSNFHYSRNMEEHESGFQLTRAFISWKYQYTTNLSSVVSVDTDNPGNSSQLERVVFIKNAFLLWEYNTVQFAFGLIGLKQFSMHERSWRNRYVFKSFIDAVKWGPSADMGISFTYSPFSLLQFDASLTNGEGYKQQQKDNNYLLNFGIVYYPGSKIKIRGNLNFRTGRSNIIKNQTVTSLFSDYTFSSGNIGIELNYLHNSPLSLRKEAIGVSIYANKFFKNIKGFARFDLVSNEKDKKNSFEYLTIAGVEYNILERLKVGPNFMWSDIGVQDAEAYIGIHTEFFLHK